MVYLADIFYKGELGSLNLPEIIFGAASFSYQYNANDHLTSTTPLRTIRLALRLVLCATVCSSYINVYVIL